MPGGRHGKNPFMQPHHQAQQPSKPLADEQSYTDDSIIKESDEYVESPEEAAAVPQN